MAKATFPAQSQSVAETAKPADSDGFVASDHRNVGSALFQGDISPLRPRANSPATLKVNVVKAEIEGFFRMVYGNNKHVTFAGGDSPTFTAPTANPRIDLLYLDVSGGTGGTLTVVTGTEAASPAEPALPSLSAAIPICYVYNRVGQTAIVNFEDSGANPTQGYIYRDVRPWVSAGGGASFGDTPTNSAPGDAAAQGSSANAARGDHLHGREAAPQYASGSVTAAVSSTADIVVSGLPFKPDIVFLAGTNYNAGPQLIWAVHSAGAKGRSFFYATGTASDLGKFTTTGGNDGLGQYYLPSTDYTSFAWISMNADGFTVRPSVSGSPTGTVDFEWFAIKF